MSITSTEWCRIQLRLDICEEIITGLFGLGFVTDDLEKKLCQLEDWIVQIPETRPELIEHWKRKLVNWWREYVTAKSNQQVQQLKECILSDQLSLSNLSFDNKPTNGSIHNLSFKSGQSDGSVNGQDLSDVQLSKQSTVLDQMKHAFGQLAPVPECDNLPEYLDRLSQVATLVTKATQSSLALGRSAGVSILKDTMFTYAFAKLSSKLQESYKQKYGGSKSVVLLFKFLSQQISDHIQREDEKRKLVNIDDVFCSYCKGNGHLSGNCPEIRAMVCFKCFKMGHKQRDCTN